MTRRKRPVLAIGERWYVQVGGKGRTVACVEIEELTRATVALNCFGEFGRQSTGIHRFRLSEVDFLERVIRH